MQQHQFRGSRQYISSHSHVMCHFQHQRQGCRDFEARNRTSAQAAASLPRLVTGILLPLPCDVSLCFLSSCMTSEARDRTSAQGLDELRGMPLRSLDSCITSEAWVSTSAPTPMSCAPVLCPSTLSVAA
eukprot:gene2647-5024_t